MALMTPDEITKFVFRCRHDGMMDDEGTYEVTDVKISVRELKYHKNGDQRYAGGYLVTFKSGDFSMGTEPNWYIKCLIFNHHHSDSGVAVSKRLSIGLDNLKLSIVEQEKVRADLDGQIDAWFGMQILKQGEQWWLPNEEVA